jgi:hypothetical protein
MLITDPEVAERTGMQPIAPETIWLLNRDAIARRYGTTPVDVEGWPAYERAIAVRMLAIEAEGEKRRPKQR